MARLPCFIASSIIQQQLEAEAFAFFLSIDAFDLFREQQSSDRHAPGASGESKRNRTTKAGALIKDELVFRAFCLRASESTSIDQSGRRALLGCVADE